MIDRALALADGEGLEAVTIRRLALDFGVTPMALYWHVKNKDELLEAMGDRIFEGLRLDDDPDAPWGVQLTGAVRALVEALRAHPASVQLATSRILSNPDGLQVTEFTLGLLRRAGFTVRQSADVAIQALQTAVMLVSSEPGAEAGIAAEHRDAALALKREQLRRLPADRFPYIHETADDLLDCDVESYYAFGVDLFVSGARATLAATRRPSPVPRHSAD